MNITIHPKKLRGTVQVIPSKSQAHRYLICAALSDNETELLCPETSRDMDATADCLRALGAKIERTGRGYRVTPIDQIPETALLPCRDSGSTLRFLLPVVGAMGVDATFQMEGRLPQRPLSPLWEEMERMGCILSRPTPDTIRCQGKLKSGDYSIDGGVSSQFVTGLMYAKDLIPGGAEVYITGRLESGSYLTMTLQAQQLFGAPRYHSPGTVQVEGDWSGGAFWLAANALGSELDIQNLAPDSPQGDRVAAHLLFELKHHRSIDAADIPDLVPILSVMAAANQGAVFTSIARLRLKESDRVESTIAMLRDLGGSAEATDDTLTVFGTGLTGGTVRSYNDHRIAMSAAIAATVCTQPVTILGAECVEKSYPKFWAEYARLGGNYEQYLR
jgi:3-phosphoshikimate 1-carboxyvinyltransferase